MATRTAGSAGNALSSQSLAAGASKTFTFDNSANIFAFLYIGVTAGGTVAATAGVTALIEFGTGSSILYDTVGNIILTVPVTTASQVTGRVVPLQQGVYQITLTNLDASNSITIVATADAHYIKQEDARAHELLMCIASGKTLNDAKRMRHTTDKLYVCGPDDMRGYFTDVPETVSDAPEQESPVS